MIQLDSTLSVLSAMITPAVLILACGSLITTTSSRLVRCIDRVREMSSEFEKVTTGEEVVESVGSKQAMLFSQLERSTTRARLLQRSLAGLYLALSCFVTTSVAIGLTAALQAAAFGWVPLTLGFIGAGLLMGVSVLLIIESRISLASTFAEMDYVWKAGQRHAAAERAGGGGKNEG